MISTVSGGTFSAYYGLRGDNTFEEFDAKVLSRNFESELAKRVVINPANWSGFPQADL